MMVRLQLKIQATDVFQYPDSFTWFTLYAADIAGIDSVFTPFLWSKAGACARGQMGETTVECIILWGYWL